jgi:hypothetical protein
MEKTEQLELENQALKETVKKLQGRQMAYFLTIVSLVGAVVVLLIPHIRIV